MISILLQIFCLQRSRSGCKSVFYHGMIEYIDSLALHMRRVRVRHTIPKMQLPFSCSSLSLILLYILGNVFLRDSWNSWHLMDTCHHLPSLQLSYHFWAVGALWVLVEMLALWIFIALQKKHRVCLGRTWIIMI
jgi:hypothetical protein